MSARAQDESLSTDSHATDTAVEEVQYILEETLSGLKDDLELTGLAESLKHLEDLELNLKSEEFRFQMDAVISDINSSELFNTDVLREEIESVRPELEYEIRAKLEAARADLSDLQHDLRDLDLDLDEDGLRESLHDLHYDMQDMRNELHGLLRFDFEDMKVEMDAFKFDFDFQRDLDLDLDLDLRPAPNP